jgi:hypothetical protein
LLKSKPQALPTTKMYSESKQAQSFLSERDSFIGKSGQLSCIR